MQALVDRIFENKSLTFVAWALALLLAAALILFIYRLAFGSRLKTPGGGRTRLPRLGVVDAFDLDRHRQLVIVRRDNVEHLLMIGGPNDLVIEAEIIRAEGRDLRLRDNAREKELREAPQAPVQAPSPALLASAPPWQPDLDPAPGRISASHAQPPRKVPVSTPAPIASASETDAEPPAPAIEEPAPASPNAAPPAPRTPAFPLPPRRVVPPLTAQRTPREPPIRPDLPSRIEAGTSASGGGFQRAPLATPFLRTSPPRQLADPKPLGASSYPAARSPAPGAVPASRRDGEPPAAGSAAASEAAASAPSDGVSAPAPEALAPVLSAERSDAVGPSRTPPGAPPAADKLADDGDKGAAPRVREEALADASNLSPIDSLEQSLEEEMARLLGRGP
jgi:flagellar protein FliO/FliZ